MHIAVLKILGSRERAAEHMAEHKAWLQRGFDDGVFIASGSLVGEPGGGILVRGATTEALRMRLDDDPFVRHGIVAVEVTELGLSKAAPAFECLLDLA